MPTLVYSPGVEILIDTHANGIVDVSEDLSRGSVTLRENAISGAQFTIINSRRKYDGMFTPNDRVTIRMKRVKWLQVFTGYLNVVPYFTVYPRSVTLSASCTLKRLQFTPVDTGTWAWAELVNEQPTDEQLTDVGIGRRVVTMLTEIANWPLANIHLGAIPEDWYVNMLALRGQLADRIDFGTPFDPTHPPVTMMATINTTLQAGTTQATAAGGATTTAPVAINGSLACFLQALRTLESNSNYTAQNPNSSASGAYQFIDTTWQSRAAGISTAPEAYLATPQEQDQVAAKMATALYEKYGSWASVGIAWYYGHVPADLNFVPYPSAGNTLTLQQYGDKIVTAMQSICGSTGAAGTPSTTWSGTGSASTQVAQLTSTQVLQLAQAGITTDYGVVGDGDGSYTSQALIAAARTKLGLPYNNTNPTRFGPDSFDCSGFVWWCHDAIGHPLPKGVSDNYFSMVIPPPFGPGPDSIKELLKIEGAVIGFWGTGNYGHIGLTIGDGSHVIEAGGTQSQVNIGNWNPDNGGRTPANIGGLLPGMTYRDFRLGGSPEAGGGSTLNVPAGATGIGGSGGTTPNNTSHSPLVLFGHQVGTMLSDLYGGLRVLMNDNPSLLDAGISPMMDASFRSYMSAPNGDFIGWFADYFDQHDVLNKMVIQDIELRDFSIVWDDQHLKTHWFVEVGLIPGFATPLPDTIPLDPAIAVQTSGIASVEIPEIMDALFGFKNAPDSRIKEIFGTAKAILDRFGARPEARKMEGLNGENTITQFWMAMRLFMKNWAEQFSAEAPLTFMPEVRPGQILKFPSFGVQAYCESVTHTFDFENGGFETTANIIAPSRMEGGSLYLLPEAPKTVKNPDSPLATPNTPNGPGRIAFPPNRPAPVQ